MKRACSSYLIVALILVIPLTTLAPAQNFAKAMGDCN